MDELYAFLLQSDLQSNKMKVMDEYIIHEEYDSDAINIDVSSNADNQIQSNIANQDVDVYDAIKQFLYNVKCMFSFSLCCSDALNLYIIC